MAQKHGLFQYIKLKLLVVILRIWVPFTLRKGAQRDEELVPPEIPVEQVRIPSRQCGRHILTHLYVPPGHPPSSSPLPVLVNWHGSGFIYSFHGSDALYSAQLARDAGIAVLDACHRLGPENTFPGALHDAEDALRWVAAQDGRFDRGRVAVSGFSAGSGLAVAAATVLRKMLRDVLEIRVLVAWYPLLDLAKAPEEKTVPRLMNPQPAWALRLYNDVYAPDVGSRTDPAVSPAFADVEDFPPTAVFVTAEGDQLRPEADAVAERLAAETEKKLVHLVVDGASHTFDKGCEEGSVEWIRREESYALVTKVLKESLL
ncbi:Alpha/Beta hydrolase protein [Hypoxylon sp. FL1284]|nr:Alpha/Beta hydrolase protein [Hypoxylon sp. FL1284]